MSAVDNETFPPAPGAEEQASAFRSGLDRRDSPPNGWPRWSRWIRWLVAIAALIAALAVVFEGLPPVDDVFATGMFQTAMIYDRNGQLLYELVDPNGGRRSVVSLPQIPRYLIEATVATEDANFYTNPGIDPASILRAVIQDVRNRQIESGASTITEQLVRNVVMSPRERQSQSLRRKLWEAILAYRVSQRYSKDQILERYLNEIYYGNLAYGVEAASETYFDKPVEQLTLGQATLLAGLPQAPTLYDPYQHPDAAKRRQREVIGLMLKRGVITPAQAETALQEPLIYRHPSVGLRAPHFVMYVRNLLEQRYSREQIYGSGLRIYTSLDLNLQGQVEAMVQNRLPLLQENNATNAAVIVIDPKTGEILTMVGSANFWDDSIHGQINMTTTARPPGSTIKTFTFLNAFDRHLAMPGTVVEDVPTPYSMGEGQPSYVPQNADGQFRGPVTVRRALANSLNVPAIKMLDRVGVDHLLTTLHRFGITSLGQPAAYYGLALTLGNEPVELLDLSYAYSALANSGVQVGEPVANADAGHRQYAPVAILKVTDAKGKVLDAYQPTPGIRLVSPEAAWLTTDILADDAARAETLGAHSALELPDRPGAAAAKVGTSESLEDAWAVGYTPQIVVGVWAGNADNRPMMTPFGARGPALVWHDVVTAVLKGHPVQEFTRPAGLVQGSADESTGLLEDWGRPPVPDWFAEGTVPAQRPPVVLSGNQASQ